MDMKLNKIAQSRLEAAMEKGYADGRVTGEGTIEDTLASIPYRKMLLAWRYMCGTARIRMRHMTR